MEFNAVINEALKRIKPETVFRLANEARPNSDYLLNTYLPERPDTSYNISEASMTIRSTMAGLVAMDSPYPKGGAVSMSDFMEKIAKMAIESDFTEAGQRKMQEIVQFLLARGNNPIQAVIENVFNFTDKLLVQPHLDTMEWLRAQALLTGGIDWTFGQQKLKVSYEFPAAAFGPSRSGTAAYNGTASTFWEDIRAAKKYLKYDVEAFIMHPDTLDAIISNDANKIEVIAQDNNSFTIARLVAGVGGGEKKSTDFRDTAKLIAYGLEAEVMDVANPGLTKSVKFITPGKILCIGRNTGRDFVLTTGVGLGGNPVDIDASKSLGYTHIGPTVEGQGAPGRWARIYIPEAKPWALVGQSVSNALPVVTATSKIHVLTSTIS